MLTQARLKEVLHYDPLTGVFTNLVARGKNLAGEVAGSKLPGDYVYITVDKFRSSSHRLAFLYMTGSLPKNVVDHINCCKEDNRWENLRAATYSENAQNTGIRKSNKTGFKGVIQKAPGKAYIARIRVDGEEHYIGSFTSKEAAALAYKLKSEELHSHRQDDNRNLDVQVSDLSKASYRKKAKRHNLSGYLGVTTIKKTGKFSACIFHNKQKIYLGQFNTAEEASAAYQAKFSELYSTP